MRMEHDTNCRLMLSRAPVSVWSFTQMGDPINVHAGEHLHDKLGICSNTTSPQKKPSCQLTSVNTGQMLLNNSQVFVCPPKYFSLE